MQGQPVRDDAAQVVVCRFRQARCIAGGDVPPNTVSNVGCNVALEFLHARCVPLLSRFEVEDGCHPVHSSTMLLLVITASGRAWKKRARDSRTTRRVAGPFVDDNANRGKLSTVPQRSAA